MKFKEKSLPEKNKTYPNKLYEFGAFVLDSTERRLFQNGQLVPLTTKLFDILLFLVINHGKLVTKEELMKRIWQDQFVEDNNLTVSISAIRKALGVKYGDHKYIETVSKSGYRFIARVKELQVEAADSNLDKGKGHKLKEQNESNDLIKILAVLPFVNETEDTDLEYISGGFHESIIKSLSQMRQIRVLAQNIVDRYKGKDLDSQRIGQELNVPVVLFGRVFQLNKTLSVSIELIDTETGVLIYGKTHNFVNAELLKTQEKIATEISKRLYFNQTSLNDIPIIKSFTKNSEAYRLFLKGRHFMTKPSITMIERAIEYFNRAIKLDETYSLAYSGLADCYSMLAMLGADSPKDIVPLAKASVVRALELDNTLAEAHTSLAKIKVNFDWDFKEAEKEYLRSIELNPYYAPTYGWYAEHLARVGLFEKGLEMVEIALEIDPLSLAINKSKGMILYLARRYDEALKHCFEAFEIEPNYTPFKGFLGYIYTQQQKYKEAISVLREFVHSAAGEYEISSSSELKLNQISQEKIIFTESDPEAIAALGFAYAKDGKRDEAIELVRGLLKLSNHRYVEPHTLAMIYIGLDEKEKAFEWLEKAFADRSSILTFLRVWAIFDSLRNDPRFIALQNKVGFSKGY